MKTDFIPELRNFKLGWQLDHYGTTNLARIVYRRTTPGQDSICYVYNRQDLREHFERKCLTNLEYLEGEEFYKAVRLQGLRTTALTALYKDQYIQKAQA